MGPGAHNRPGPDVGAAGSLAGRRGVADELLGGAVPSRAAVRDAGVRGAELGRLAEIGELGDAVGDEHVLRLDVAVGPTALVAVLEGDEEMSNGRRDDGLGKRAQAALARALDELQEVGVAPLRDEEHLTSLARHLHRAEHVRAPRDGLERAKLGGGEEILPARGVVRLLQVLDGVELASIVTDALARRPNGRESALAETFEKHVLVQYHRAGRAIGDPRKGARASRFDAAAPVAAVLPWPTTKRALFEAASVSLDRKNSKESLRSAGGRPIEPESSGEKRSTALPGRHGRYGRVEGFSLSVTRRFVRTTRVLESRRRAP